MTNTLIDNINRLTIRLHRLHIDLQHLVVLTFPKTQTHFGLYLLLSHPIANVFSEKLTTHPVYSKSISTHLDSPDYVIYYKNGRVQSEMWRKNGHVHREGDLPAFVSYYENGQICSQSWHKHGRMHRDTKDDLPAVNTIPIIVDTPPTILSPTILRIVYWSEFVYEMYIKEVQLRVANNPIKIANNIKHQLLSGFTRRSHSHSLRSHSLRSCIFIIVLLALLVIVLLAIFDSLLVTID